MDPRLKTLSYSSCLTLHSCARKYQLYKLGADGEQADEDGTKSLTFAFGHTVGEGLQDSLKGLSEETILFRAFAAWNCDLLADDPKRSKSFWFAVAAIKRFIAARKAGLLKGFVLASYNGKPAVELGFWIQLPNGFVYRGFVDAVLVHETTGEVLVLENKTTWFTVNPAQYKNSAQAIGYSIVLDVLFPELSSYKVLYLIYQTKQFQWERFDFIKSYLQRAQWIQELLFDAEDVARYDAAGIFPMRGESCVSFGRECEYLQICGMNTKFLTKPITEEGLAALETERNKYDVILTLEQLINKQLEKTK